MLGAWVKQQKVLIDLERESEIAQLTDKITSLGAKDCQNEGLSILNLEIDGTRSAMFGRCCIVLQKMDKKQIQSTFKVGDEVNLYNPKMKTSSTDGDNGTVFGLISKVTHFKIEMVVEDFDENNFDAPLRMDLRSNQKTHNKMIEAISSLEGSDHPLVQMLFSDQSQMLDHRVAVQDVKLTRMFNSGLNDSQIGAIKCSLGSPFVSLIHGPPGTGKTSTLTELILQAVQRDLKVLVCAPSNIAVDTILARLADSSASTSGTENVSKGRKGGGAKSDYNSNSGSDYLRKLNMVRLGHPARISANILKYSLDSLIESDEGTEIVQDVRKDIETLRKSLSTRGTKTKRIDYNLRREQRTELRALSKEAKKRERTVVERILSRCNVVLSTCIGASSRLLTQCEFDLVVIDEAAQGLEAACWVPLLLAKKCVLAGDHCQLPPTIKCDAAVKGGLAITLFERVMHDPRFAPVVKLLNVQYRMNDLISQWASREMYGGLIHSDSSVATHTLRDILPRTVTSSTQSDNDVAVATVAVSVTSDIELRPSESASATDVHDVEEEEDLFPVMLLIDTASCGMHEELVSSSGSHRNVHEADILVRHIQALLRAGVKVTQIGVITPYNGQLEVLRGLILPAAENETNSANNGNSSANNSSSSGSGNLSMEGVEIKTIDGFQGGEKECILISLVRSNDKHQVGFLSDTRRMNVAVTRAKRHVTVVCDTETCGTNPFIHSLVSHMALRGEHISAYEYMDSVESGVGGISIGGGGETVFRAPKIAIKASNSIKPSRPLSSDLDFRALFTSLIDNSTVYGNVVVTAENILLSPTQQLDIANNTNIPSKYTKQPVLQSSTSLVFPSSLNSYQRMQCHDVATQMGLFHRSVGEGSDRHIEVSKEVFPEVSVTTFEVANKVEKVEKVEKVVTAVKTIKQQAVKITQHTVKPKHVPTVFVKETRGSGCGRSNLLNLIPEPKSVQNRQIDSTNNVIDITSSNTTIEVSKVVKEVESEEEDSEEDIFAAITSSSTKSTPRNAEILSVLSADQNTRNVRVSGKINAKANDKQQSEYQTASKAAKKIKSNNNAAKTQPPSTEEEDDAFLNAAILENQKIANLHQYRVGGSALPNHERDCTKRRLHDKLLEAQSGRRATSSVEEESGSGNNKNNNKNKEKVVKKPVPNFGGGKLGTK